MSDDVGTGVLARLVIVVVKFCDWQAPRYWKRKRRRGRKRACVDAIYYSFRMADCGWKRRAGPGAWARVKNVGIE